MTTYFLTKSTTVLDIVFSPCSYSPIYKTMPVYVGAPISGSEPIPQVTFSGWNAQIVMTTRGLGVNAYQFSANLYPTTYSGQMVAFNVMDPFFAAFISSQPLHDGLGYVPTVQFSSAQGVNRDQWTVNQMAKIAPGDTIGAVTKSGTISQMAFSGTNTSMGQGFPVPFYVDAIGTVLFCDGFGTTTSFTNWGGVLVQVDTGLYWTSNNGTNLTGSYDLNYRPAQNQRNWTNYISTPVNGSLCRITNYPTLVGNPTNRIAFMFTNSYLVTNINLLSPPASQGNRIQLGLVGEDVFAWPEIEVCSGAANTWRVCYTEYGALIYGANDGTNDLNFYQRTPSAKVYYVDFPSRMIYPVRMTTTDNAIFTIANEPGVVGTPDSLFTEFVWGRDGLYYVSNYGMYRTAAMPNAGYSGDPNGACAAITVARATFVPPPRPVIDTIPRTVRHFPYIDPRSFTDTDKPK